MKFNETFNDFMNLYVEGYDPKDKAYNRTPEEQAEIDRKKAQFKKNSEKLAKEEPYPKVGGGPSHASPAPRSEDAEMDFDEDVISDLAAIDRALDEGATVADIVRDYGSELMKMYIDYRTHPARQEDAEDKTGEEIDEFHKALDELVHKHLGHSSNETSEEDAEKVDKDRMKCNSPRRTSGGSKKFVVKACKDGKEKVVRFGDPNMKIKKSNPKRRKSFRARHKCDQKKDKFSAGYWSCKKW